LFEEKQYSKLFPAVTLGVVTANVIVFIFEYSLPLDVLESFLANYGATPIDLVNGRNLYTILTSMFLHGGIAHIFMNMYALLVFGNDVESAFGRIGFLLFYLISGVGATVFNAVLTVILTPAAAGIPGIGASGAIFSIMAAYATLFPKRMIYTFSGFFLIRIRAIYFILLYAMIETLYAISSVSIGEFGGVAHLAHIGGFLTGLIGVALFWSFRRGRFREARAFG